MRVHLGMLTTAILAVKVSADRVSRQVNFVDEDTTRVDCSDVNECLSNNGKCANERTCINTVGSSTCGDCPSGYVNDGDTGCKGQCRPNVSSCEFC